MVISILTSQDKGHNRCTYDKGHSHDTTKGDQHGGIPPLNPHLNGTTTNGEGY